jgi:hypothetical protein
MATGDKDMTELIQQHQAIKAHMGFLTKSLKKLTNQSHTERMTSTQLKEQITLYRWSLYDFREAIRRHIELDEHIFQKLLNHGSIEDLSKEHEEIQNKINDVITHTENAVYSKLGNRELYQSAKTIKEEVKSVCKVCQSHMAEEDSLLQAKHKNV